MTIRTPILPSALRELLRRRDELLAADERAAVEAALASATPEERVELERRIAYWRERAEAARLGRPGGGESEGA